MNWIRTGECHQECEQCGDYGCCWLIHAGESIVCPSASMDEGMAVCNHAVYPPVYEKYWGDPDAQDAMVSEYSESVPEEDRWHYCRRFPWKPQQIGAESQCGYDFICDECEVSFRDHPHEDFVIGECSNV